MKVGDAEAEFSEEGWGEDVVVVDAGAIGALVAGALEAATGRAADEGTEGGRLKGEDALPAVTTAEVVTLIQGVVHFDVVAVGGLLKGQVDAVVVGRVREIGLVLIGSRKELQQGEGGWVDAADRDPIAGKGRAIAAVRRSGCRIVDLAA